MQDGPMNGYARPAVHACGQAESWLFTAVYGRHFSLPSPLSALLRQQ
jgi:hypothetical protein